MSSSPWIWDEKVWSSGIYAPYACLPNKLMLPEFLNSFSDLLHRFQLWSTATEIIKLSRLPNVNTCNQQSTTVHTICNNCGRSLNRVGWWCEKCKRATNTCSVWLVCLMLRRPLYLCSRGWHLFLRGGKLAILSRWDALFWIWAGPEGNGYWANFAQEA